MVEYGGMSSGPNTDLIESGRRLDAALTRFARFNLADYELIEAEIGRLKADRARFELLAAEAMSRAAQVGGRPIKASRKGQRSRISVDLSAPTRAAIANQAKISGRTLAREAEIMIEGFLNYLQMQEQMRTTMEEISKGNVENALLRLGYTPIRAVREGKAQKLWAEPGFPGFERSGFVPWEEGELEALFPKQPEQANRRVTPEKEESK
jgi:hypothetical protein